MRTLFWCRRRARTTEYTEEHGVTPGCLATVLERNEKSLPYPRRGDGGAALLCALSGFGGGTHRTHYGRCAADLLLPCAFGLDGVYFVLHQFWGIGYLSYQAQS